MVLAPELEHEQGPERLAQVGAAFEVRAQQRAYCGRVEDSGVAQSALREQLLEEGTKRSADPGGDRNAKSLLGAAKDLVRHDAAERALQDHLRARERHLQPPGQARGKLHYPCVQVRRAQL